jgi:uncharacterized protein (TIRG00374 family)
LAQAALADLAGWRAQRVLLIVGLLVLAAVVIVSLHIGEIGEFGRQLARTKPSWIAAAIFAQVFAFLFIGLAWGAALRSLGARQRAHDLFPLTLGTLFADQAIPSAGLSGALFIFHSLTRRGVSRDVALTVFILGAASFIAAFIINVAASFAILAMRDGTAAGKAIEATGIAVAAFVVLGGAMLIGVLHFKLVREWMARRTLLRRVSEFASRAAASISEDRTLFARCVLRQLLARGFDVVTLLVCFAAIGEHTSLEAAFVAISLASLATTVAPTPMGIGTFEGSMVALLTSFGASIETALAGTLLYRGLSLWAPLSLGFFVVQRELLAQRAQPAPPTEAAANSEKS